MEKLLERIADQLDSLDEASLMNLWSKYAQLALNYKPGREWERAVLVFCLIQAKHMKNQLFNYHWTTSRRKEAEAARPGLAQRGGGAGGKPERKTPCPVLQFDPQAGRGHIRKD